jgi:hypothetical protein
MAKERYEVPFEDTKKIFNDVITVAELDNFINVKLLTDNKMKTITKLQKASPLVKFETKNDLYVFINETVFEQLEPWQQVIVAEETIAGAYFNSEKDRLEIKKGDITTFSGILSKYGYDKYEVVLESIKTLYNLEQETAEA